MLPPCIPLHISWRCWVCSKVHLGEECCIYVGDKILTSILLCWISQSSLEQMQFFALCVLAKLSGMHKWTLIKINRYCFYRQYLCFPKPCYLKPLTACKVQYLWTLSDLTYLNTLWYTCSIYGREETVIHVINEGGQHVCHHKSHASPVSLRRGLTVSMQ